MGRLTPCFALREGSLYTMTAGGGGEGGDLLPSSFTLGVCPGGMVNEEY